MNFSFKNMDKLWRIRDNISWEIRRISNIWGNLKGEIQGYLGDTFYIRAG